VTSAFVGDWTSVDFSGMSDAGMGLNRLNDMGAGKNLSDGLQGWHMDLCILESQYGNLTVSYAKD